jgi:hypothetical protein
MYSPQRDKTLNTSKKEVRNGGISNYPNPQKINPKYTLCKPIVKIGFGKGNSIGKILISIKFQ